MGTKKKMMVAFLNPFIKKRFSAVIVGLMVIATIFTSKPSAHAFEFSGITLDMMNSNSTNFYGLGFFTSDKLVTAGVSVLFPTEFYAGLGNSEDKDTPDTHLYNRSYPLYSLLFYGQYNLIRTSRTSYFFSFGIQPFVPNKYVYSFGGGVEYFQSESIRFVFEFKNIYSNYLTDSDGESAYSNRIANGPSFSFGIKFALIGKKDVKFGEKNRATVKKTNTSTKNQNDGKAKVKWGRERY